MFFLDKTTTTLLSTGDSESKKTTERDNRQSIQKEEGDPSDFIRKIFK